jgi:hypothetical protein
MILTPNIRPRLDLRGDVVAITVGVSVGERVIVGEGRGVLVAGPGVNVAVAGGVTARTNFWPGRMTDVLFNPFQDIKSISGTS